MSGRTPEEILAAFGRDLRRVDAPRRSRVALVLRRSRRARVALALAAILATGAASAAATGQLFAPSPRVSAPARPAGAPVPDAASRPVYVAAGRGWRLSASACRFGARTRVAVFLAAGGGGAGWRCDALSRRVAAGIVPPPAVYTPTNGSALLFGAAPARTVSVQALLLPPGAAAAEAVEVRATATRLATAVYVARLPEGARLLSLVGLDAQGRPTMRCDQETCR